MVETISSKLDKPLLVLGSTGNLGVSLKELVGNHPRPLFPNRQELDLSDQKSVLEYLNQHTPFCIINSAAWTDVEGAETNQNEASFLNSELPKILGIWCEQHESRLIHISTDYVFDGNKTQPYEEDDATNPISIYGVTKLAGEIAITEVMSGNFSIVRTSALYGYTPQNFVVKMMKRALQKEKVRVVSNQVMSPTSSTDLANFCINLTKDYSFPRLIHFSNQGTTNWFEFTQMIYELVGEKRDLVSPISSEDFVSKAKRPVQSKLETNYPHLVNDFNYDWQVSLKSFVEKVVTEHVELLS